VGPNGSGKTTLLRLMRGDIQPSRGKIRRADQLRIVYFDQNRELNPDVTLKRARAPDADSVVYQDRVIHVAAHDLGLTSHNHIESGLLPPCPVDSRKNERSTERRYSFNLAFIHTVRTSSVRRPGQNIAKKQWAR